MGDRFSDFVVEQWLGDFSECWAALHHDDPDVAGAYASEVFGGSYGRVKAFFTAPSNRAVLNTNVLSFTGLPSVKLTHVAMWDAAINGNFLVSMALPNPTMVLAGKRYDIGANQVGLSFA